MRIAESVIFFTFISFIPFNREVFQQHESASVLHHMTIPPFQFFKSTQKRPHPLQGEVTRVATWFRVSEKIRISISDTIISYPFSRRAPVGYYSHSLVSLHLSKVHSTWLFYGSLTALPLSLRTRLCLLFLVAEFGISYIILQCFCLFNMKKTRNEKSR